MDLLKKTYGMSSQKKIALYIIWITSYIFGLAAHSSNQKGMYDSFQSLIIAWLNL